MYFEVPKRLRPEGWPPAIPLPRAALRTGKLGAEEAAAIRKDAAELFDLLKSGGDAGKVGRPSPRTITTLVATWQRSPEWDALSQSTKEGYDFLILRVLAWSLERGHPDPALMTQPAVLSFLANFTQHPSTKKKVAQALALIMQQAVSLGWRTDNPVRGIRIKVAKPKTNVWEQRDVDHYVTAANAQGLLSIALLVLLMWEIGQRLTDIRGFKSGVEYDPKTGTFAFHQSKTGSAVTIEISETLRDLLGESIVGGVLFRDERTGKPYSQHRLSHTFAVVRGAVVKGGGRPLILRQLRHSCVVQLARAGCTVPEIASVTGHTLGSVNSILGTYLPRDSTVARNAQIKRGLVVDHGAPTKRPR